MTKHLRKFLQDHLDSPGVVIKTGQSVAPITDKSFGQASDVTGVVRPAPTAALAGHGSGAAS